LYQFVKEHHEGQVGRGLSNLTTTGTPRSDPSQAKFCEYSLSSVENFSGQGKNKDRHQGQYLEMLDLSRL
jgi:hypothetical protein